MKIGPDIARVASLIGDPARANILTALIAGKALTGTELALEAGVTLQTASSHLSKLQQAGLVAVEQQGRHRYWRLDGDEIAQVLEALMGLAVKAGHTRIRTGPKEPALRRARVCYDHLAGEYGVALFDAMRTKGFLEDEPDGPAPTQSGRAFAASFGIDLPALERTRRPLCRRCLDWSVRRSHLAGTLGRALFERILAEGWARREPGSRIVTFTSKGDARFAEAFQPVPGDAASA